MTRMLRVLVALVLALGAAALGSGRLTCAAGGQVADCTFAPLQSDLQEDGDWFYAAGR
jgi:hypothetical protein